MAGDRDDRRGGRRDGDDFHDRGRGRDRGHRRGGRDDFGSGFEPGGPDQFGDRQSFGGDDRRGGYRGGGDRQGGGGYGDRQGGGGYGNRQGGYGDRQGGGGYGDRQGGGGYGDRQGGGGYGDRPPRGDRPRPERGPRQTGTVKFFNRDKGFGFIVPDSGERDIFVHISAVERGGFQTLDEGQKISFETEADRMGRGPKAVFLREIEDGGDQPGGGDGSGDAGADDGQV